MVRKIGMGGNPSSSDRMHAVRSADIVGRRGRVAGGTFHHHAGVALDIDIPDIVIGVDAGEFRVRRAVAGLALKPAVTAGKTEQRKPACRSIGLRGKCLVHRHAHREIRIGEDRGITNLAVVACRRAGVTACAVWFHEPADPSGRANRAHVTVTALALHCHRAIRRNGAAHHATQTFRGGTWMTPVARRAIGRTVERHTGHRIYDVRVKTMNGGCELWNSGKAGFAERFGGMARRAKHGMIIGHHAAIKTLRIKSVGRQGCLINRTVPGELVFVVQPENVQAKVAFLNSAPNPTGGGLRGGH